MVKNLELDKREKIDSLFFKSYSELKVGNYNECYSILEEAWALIPGPVYNWDVSWSFIRAKVKILSELDKVDLAIELVDEYIDSGYMLEYEDGPFFLKGKLFFLMGRKEKSFELFNRANSISRGRCFRDEDEKYLNFYLSEKGGD